MITISVKGDDGTSFEVTASSRDVLVWERTSRPARSFSQLAENMTMIDMYRIAWIAARREQLLADNLSLGDFERDFEVLPVAPEGDGLDPTRAAP